MEKGREKIKVCYVMPRYSEDLDSHIFYLYDFLKRAAEILDVYLIIEKSDTRKIEGSFKKVSFQKFSGVVRYLENFLLIAKARFLGYKNFYVHYSYVGAINAILVSRLTGARTFYWSCGMMWLFKKKFKLSWGTFKDKLTKEWPLKFILKQVDYLVTGNETMKLGYYKHYNIPLAKIKVMPNWIDLERFNPDKFDRNALREKYDIPLHKKVVLFVHHLSERKGADLISPIAEELKSDEDVIFIVCGGGPYKSKLEKEIDAKGLRDMVRLEGAVPNRKIPEYFAIADVFLMPSREEGFPRVLLESMAMNVPYIASDVGGVREITPDILADYIIGGFEVSDYCGPIRSIFNISPAFDSRSYDKRYDTENILKIFYSLFNK